MITPIVERSLYTGTRTDSRRSSGRIGVRPRRRGTAWIWFGVPDIETVDGRGRTGAGKLPNTSKTSTSHGSRHQRQLPADQMMRPEGVPPGMDGDDAVLAVQAVERFHRVAGVEVVGELQKPEFRDARRVGGDLRLIRITRQEDVLSGHRAPIAARVERTPDIPV